MRVLRALLWCPPSPLTVLTGWGTEGGALFGVPSESSSCSRSCWGWGVGCGGFVRVWQALRSRPPARLRRSRAPPFRPVLRKVTSCLLAGPSRLNGRTRGRWNRLACMSSRISGSAQCDGGPKEGRQSSMRCIWARASILTAWAPSHLLPSLHRPHPRPIRTRPAEQEKEFTSTSTLTPESNGAGRQTLAEPMKVSGPHELM